MRTLDHAWPFALGLTLVLSGCPEQAASGTRDGGATIPVTPTPTAPGTTTPAPGEETADAGLGRSCGSRGQAPCGADEFCDFPLGASCGETDKPGACKTIKRGCTKEYDPVCGCDGKTYGNLCAANAESVSARSTGACPSEDAGAVATGKACGGLAGLSCEKSEFCSFAPEAQCGAADRTGTCAKRPEACIQIFKPVCGCDDKTYGNACQAAAAGVSVVHDGEC